MHLTFIIVFLLMTQFFVYHPQTSNYSLVRQLDKASIWFKANKLTLNVSKTKFMIFRNKKMPLDENDSILQIGGRSLERIGNHQKI